MAAEVTFSLPPQDLESGSGALPELPEVSDLAFEPPPFEPPFSLLRAFAELLQQVAPAAQVQGPLEWGDRLSIDLIGFVNGVPLPESALSEVSWILSEDCFLPGFGKTLQGLPAKGQYEIYWVLPADYPVAAWAGQKAQFKIKLHSAERLTLPLLNDAFVQRTGLGTSLGELEAQLAQAVEQQNAKALLLHRLEHLLQALWEAWEYPLSAQAIDAAMQQLWQETLLPALKVQGLSEQQSQSAWPFWRENRAVRSQCRENLQKGLLYQALIEQQNLVLTAQELSDFLAAQLQRSGLSPEEAEALLVRSGQWDSLKVNLLIQKANHLLLSASEAYASSDYLAPPDLVTLE